VGAASEGGEKRREKRKEKRALPRSSLSKKKEKRCKGEGRRSCLGSLKEGLSRGKNKGKGAPLDTFREGGEKKTGAMALDSLIRAARGGGERGGGIGIMRKKKKGKKAPPSLRGEGGGTEGGKKKRGKTLSTVLD